MVRTVFGLSHSFAILIVDDGSPDGTAQIIRELQLEFPDQLHLLERSGKLGLGTAYIAGFKWALARGYEFIFEMDADFSHNPQDLLRLYEACSRNGADLAVGSRYVRGGNVKDWPWDRILLSYGASLYVRLITQMPVKDPTAGFVCYHKKVLATMDLDRIRFVGYAFQIEMKYTAHRLGFSIHEVPITFKDRELGVSKMSGRIIKEAALGVLQLRFGNTKNTKQPSELGNE